MKQIARYVAVLIVCLFAAGTAKAQFRYGPVAGLSYSNLHFKQNDIATVKAIPAFQAGLQTEMMFPGIGFGIDFGLFYNMSGAKVNLGERHMWQSQGYGNETLMMHEITLPFHLRFKYTNLNGLEEVFAPFVYIGPDFHIQVAHSKCDAMHYSGGDVALVGGIGAELMRNWQVSVQYTYGGTYAVKANLLTDYSAQSRQWTLRVAYLF